MTANSVGASSGEVPAGPLSPSQIQRRYQDLAKLLNELEAAGEELTLTHNDRLLEIRGLTSRVSRMERYRRTWRAET